jgi:hypothetical protein
MDRLCPPKKIRNGVTPMTEDMRSPILPGTAAFDYERHLRTDELLALWLRTPSTLICRSVHPFAIIQPAERE